MIHISDDITLISLSLDDASDIFIILDGEREYMREWLPFVDHTHEAADTFKALQGLVASENKQFTIRHKEQLVGLIGFKDTDFTNKRTEIGYWLSESAQGKGIMTQAVRALLGYAFSEMNMNRVQIKTAVENIKSSNIPKRLGFQLEGIERDGELLVDNVYTDINVFSLLKKEFKG